MSSLAPAVELRRQRRANQQSKDCGLAMILVSTVTTFFLLHTPRYYREYIIQCSFGEFSVSVRTH